MNNTGSSQIYTYTYELSCDGRYVRKVDNVQISPGGYVADGVKSLLNGYHTFAGSFPTRVVTKIDGESSDFKTGAATLKVG